MKVVLTAKAVRDLEAIGDRIFKDNPERALSFVEELRACCLSLKEQPRAWPVVPRYEALGIRRRLHRGYLIFYRISAERIEVIHILHGARHYEPLLFPEE